jgi:hypothetical protein
MLGTFKILKKSVYLRVPNDPANSRGLEVKMSLKYDSMIHWYIGRTTY